jgi:hypothetical protein
MSESTTEVVNQQSPRVTRRQLAANRLGITLEELDRKQYGEEVLKPFKENFGCVITALESGLSSAVGSEIKATNTELERRMNDVTKALENYIQPYIVKLINGESIQQDPTSLDNFREVNIQIVNNMINDFSRSDTQMGRAINQVIINQEDMDVNQIRNKIAEGSQVLAYVRIPNKELNMNLLHLTHLGLNGDGKFVGLSDNFSHSYNLLEGEKIKTIVLAPK